MEREILELNTVLVAYVRVRAWHGSHGYFHFILPVSRSDRVDLKPAYVRVDHVRRHLLTCVVVVARVAFEMLASLSSVPDKAS